MPNPNIAKAGEATRFQPGVSGNPAGPAPGYKQLSTVIQRLLNDDKFTATVRQGLEIKEYKGAPIEAIVSAQMHLAVNGDQKAFDLLGKYGFGSKLELANNPDNPIAQSVDADTLAAFIASVKNGINKS